MIRISRRAASMRSATDVMRKAWASPSKVAPPTDQRPRPAQDHAAEFIRRFLLHVLPSGFYRIRHYGLFAGTVRARNIERARQALAASEDAPHRSRAEADSEAEAKSCACTPLPVLRRKDDHRRDVRRAAPCAFTLAEAQSGSTPHDRRRPAFRIAMPIAFASAARRSRTAMSSQTSAEPLHASSRARASHLRDRTSSSSSFRSTRSPPCRSRPDAGAPSAILKS